MSEVTITLLDESKRDELIELVASLSYVGSVQIDEDQNITDSGTATHPSHSNGNSNISTTKSNGALPQQDPLDQEVAAFEAMHKRLVEEFLGQHIAMYQGKVIAHHVDLGVLITNVHRTHPNVPVLFRQVEETLPPILIFRSPRMEKR